MLNRRDAKRLDTMHAREELAATTRVCEEKERKVYQLMLMSLSSRVQVVEVEAINIF